MNMESVLTTSQLPNSDSNVGCHERRGAVFLNNTALLLLEQSFGSRADVNTVRGQQCVSSSSSSVFETFQDAACIMQLAIQTKESECGSCTGNVDVESEKMVLDYQQEAISLPDVPGIVGDSSTSWSIHQKLHKANQRMSKVTSYRTETATATTHTTTSAVQEQLRLCIIPTVSLFYDYTAHGSAEAAVTSLLKSGRAASAAWATDSISYARDNSIFFPPIMLDLSGTSAVPNSSRDNYAKQYFELHPAFSNTATAATTTSLTERSWRPTLLQIRLEELQQTFTVPGHQDELISCIILYNLAVFCLCQAHSTAEQSQASAASVGVYVPGGSNTSSIRDTTTAAKASTDCPRHPQEQQQMNQSSCKSSVLLTNESQQMISDALDLLYRAKFMIEVLLAEHDLAEDPYPVAFHQGTMILALILTAMIFAKDLHNATEVDSPGQQVLNGDNREVSDLDDFLLDVDEEDEEIMESLLVVFEDLCSSACRMATASVRKMVQPRRNDLYPDAQNVGCTSEIHNDHLLRLCLVAWFEMIHCQSKHTSSAA